MDAAVEAGNILLRRLEGTVRGAHFRASGMLGDGGKLSDGKLSVETMDATRLADLLPISWRATPALWQGAARLDVQAAGPYEALDLNIRLALADAQLEASPTLNLKSGEWGTRSHCAILGHVDCWRRLACHNRRVCTACPAGWAMVRCRWSRTSPVDEAGWWRTSST